MIRLRYVHRAVIVARRRNNRECATLAIEIRTVGGGGISPLPSLVRHKADPPDAIAVKEPLHLRNFARWRLESTREFHVGHRVGIRARGRKRNFLDAPSLNLRSRLALSLRGADKEKQRP